VRRKPPGGAPAIAATLALLAACGQTGPLELPELSGGAVIVTPPPATPPAPAEDEADRKEQREP
jgi:predicted small lipoprotein YifL